MSFLRGLIKLIIGLIILFIFGFTFAFILSGFDIEQGLGNLFFITFLIVACTAGSGGVVIGLIAYAIGHLIFKLFGLNPPKIDEVKMSHSIVGLQTSKTLSITQYIKQSRILGTNDINIVAELLKVGWSKDQVQAAFILLQSNQPST